MRDLHLINRIFLYMYFTVTYSCSTLMILDCPDPPRFPQVENIFQDSCLLTWKPPMNDGGSCITNYVIEKCEPPSQHWIKSATPRLVRLLSSDNIPTLKHLVLST